MSHFYGTLSGSRGEASRCGTKKSGMITNCASWEGTISCHAFYDEKTGQDWVTVEKQPWHGKGEYKMLYSGKLGSEKK